MVASRNRPKAGRIGPFGLSVLALGLVPTQIGYQDLAALLVRQHDVTQRARAYAMASPFGTIHAATFSFPRPIGSQIPELPVFQNISLHGGDPDFTGAFSGADRLGERPLQFPTVNRALKGDALAIRREPGAEQPGSRDLAPGRVKTVTFPRPKGPAPAVEETTPEAEIEREAEVSALPVVPQALSLPKTLPQPVAELPWLAEAEPEPESVEAVPQSYTVASLPPVAAPAPQEAQAVDPIDHDDPLVRMSRLYFGGAPVGRNVGPIERWPGEGPILLMQPSLDSDIKRTALAPLPKSEDRPGEMVAPKGQVTGPSQRPKSPAERLGLTLKDRAKAEKCLAEAVYFESRGEPKRGQIAVAQVVMNRVFSGYYPNNVCDVVYQNKHRYNACQFTFACDSVKDVVNDPPLWKQATEIARDTLDGKLWLHDIGKSTHYHAYWVHPWWVGTMRKLSRIGVHTFYRPKRWGDGADAPAWGPGIALENVSEAKS